MIRVFSVTYQRSTMWLMLWALLAGGLSGVASVHAGDMYRWVDEQGRLHLTDTPPQAKRELQDLQVYKSREAADVPQTSDIPAVDAGRANLTSTKPGGTVVVEAVLNQRLTVPMVLDTGADLTVLTKEAAKDLWIPALDRLPKLPFKTAGGMVNLPITTLQSLRVGTAEVRDVTIAIDVDGHLPMGLLGMTFLRYFKVTVDQQRGQVTFER
jgi:clan AA aspartic protease (TIGR02281 family)